VGVRAKEENQDRGHERCECRPLVRRYKVVIALSDIKGCVGCAPVVGWGPGERGPLRPPPELSGESGEKFESGDVLVVIRDSGLGLSPEARERIFDAFYTTKAGRGRPQNQFPHDALGERDRLIVISQHRCASGSPEAGK
jgi:signal transduction histidine kinase